MKKLSATKPKYDFNPNTSEAWDGGTYSKDQYTEAAKAPGTRTGRFEYDRGATFA